MQAWRPLPVRTSTLLAIPMQLLSVIPAAGFTITFTREAPGSTENRQLSIALRQAPPQLGALL